MATVRELRKRLGLSTHALAYKAGVSTAHITLWEKYGLPRAAVRLWRKSHARWVWSLTTCCGRPRTQRG